MEIFVLWAVGIWCVSALVAFVFIQLVKTEYTAFESLDWFLVTTPIVNTLLSLLMVVVVACLLVMWIVEDLVKVGGILVKNLRNKRVK